MDSPDTSPATEAAVTAASLLRAADGSDWAKERVADAGAAVNSPVRKRPRVAFDSSAPPCDVIATAMELKTDLLRVAFDHKSRGR